MDKKELIINTAKEILIAHVQKGGEDKIDKIGDDFKLLVTKVKEAVDSIEKPQSFIKVDLEASNDSSKKIEAAGDKADKILDKYRSK